MQIVRSTTRTAAWRLLTPLIVLALLASALYFTTRGASGNELAPDFSLDQTYINYAAPHAQPSSDGKEVKGEDGVFRPAGNGAFDQALAVDRKFAGGNPRDAAVLAKVEEKAQKSGKSPRNIKQAPSTQEARLLTILVEFNDEANDDFTETMVPETVFESRACVPGTVQNGPLHNNLPDPASFTHEDNNSMWVPDFSPEFYDQLLYTDEGVTDRIRTDLTGPDGGAGIDISGYK
jgi:immune inhibitor A